MNYKAQDQQWATLQCMEEAMQETVVGCKETTNAPMKIDPNG